MMDDFAAFGGRSLSLSRLYLENRIDPRRHTRCRQEGSRDDNTPDFLCHSRKSGVGYSRIGRRHFCISWLLVLFPFTIHACVLVFTTGWLIGKLQRFRIAKQPSV